MIASYLILFKRHLAKYTLNTSVMIFGLALGIASFMLLGIYAYEEFTADKFHHNYDDLYQVDMEYVVNGKSMMSIPPPAGLKYDLDKVSGILNSSRLHKWSQMLVTVDDRSFYEDNFYFADESLSELFDFKLQSGSWAQVLEQPYQLAISEKLAKKYFGREDIIGQSVRVDTISYTIAGVLAPTPVNSSFDIQLISSFKTRQSMGLDLNSYREGHSYLYVNTKHWSTDTLGSKIKSLLDEKLDDAQLEPIITAFSDLYFSGDSKSFRRNRVYASTFFLIAVTILLLALINYVNLSTARFSERMKEIGVKKVVGASRLSLIKQLLIESFIITSLATILAIGLLELALPLFNSLLVNPVDHQILLTREFIGVTLLSTIIVSILAGIYPALLLSALRPSVILKKKLIQSRSGFGLRNTLISVQFIITVVLIVGALAVNKQIEFWNSINLGFDGDKVLSIDVPRSVKQNIDILKNETLKLPGVKSVTVGPLPKLDWMTSIEANGQSKPLMIFLVDQDFLSTLDIQLTEGRNLIDTDRGTSNVLINEQARRFVFGDSSAVGNTFLNDQVVGVTADFNFLSAKAEIPPLMMKFHNNHFNKMILKFGDVPADQLIANVKSTWAKLLDINDVEYVFLDQAYNAKYKSEKLFSKLVNSFCLISILIASIGLFGLAQFVLNKRTKEIGIRKVLGSGRINIAKLMTLGFLKPILFSILFAFPIAYLMLEDWLTTFANRITLNGLMFLKAVIITAFISIAAVTYQIIKSIHLKPIDTITDE